MASVEDLRNAQRGSLIVIDIRKNPDEQQIPGSVRCDGAALESGDVPFSKSERLVLYCGSGNSCSRVAAAMRERGYLNADALEGGYKAWIAAGLPTESRST